MGNLSNTNFVIATLIVPLTVTRWQVCWLSLSVHPTTSHELAVV